MYITDTAPQLQAELSHIVARNPVSAAWQRCDCDTRKMSRNPPASERSRKMRIIIQ